MVMIRRLDFLALFISILSKLDVNLSWFFINFDTMLFGKYPDILSRMAFHLRMEFF